MSSSRSRCLAALLLCLYGLAATPMTSLAFMGVASLCHEHEVRVEMDGNGTLQVVLHHEHAITPGIRDHHDSMDRLLAMLCTSSSSGDHVFHVAASSAALEPKSARASERVNSPNSKWSQAWILPTRFHLQAQTLITVIRVSLRADLPAEADGREPRLGTLVLLV